MTFLLDVRKNSPSLRSASEVFCTNEANCKLLMENHSKINTILSTNTIKRKITWIRAVLIKEEEEK